jgi:hypothetical protein
MPYLGSTVFVATMVALLVLSLLAWWLLLRALAPAHVGRCAATVQHAPLRSIAVGGLAGGLALGLGVGLLSAPLPPIKLLGAVIAIAVLAFASAGLSGLAQHVGRRLGAEDAGAAGVLRGGAVLLGAAAVPFFGWFALVPLGFFLGVGAQLAALAVAVFQRGGAAGAR